MFKRILSGFRGTAALPQDDDLPEERPSLPRSAVMLLPKQRYMSWLKSWDKDVNLNLAQARQNAIVYLIPWCETLAEAQEYVEQNHQAFFEQELSTWTTDRRVWPQDRCAVRMSATRFSGAGVAGFVCDQPVTVLVERFSRLTGLLVTEILGDFPVFSALCAGGVRTVDYPNGVIGEAIRGWATAATSNR